MHNNENAVVKKEKTNSHIVGTWFFSQLLEAFSLRIPVCVCVLAAGNTRVSVGRASRFRQLGKHITRIYLNRELLSKLKKMIKVSSISSNRRKRVTFAEPEKDIHVLQRHERW